MGNILLVEDDKDLRELWELFLEPLGHDIYHAENGLGLV